MPVPEPIVATAVLLLLHTPPPTASPSVVVSAAQTDAAPVIPVGDRLTVTVMVLMQSEVDV